MQRPSRLRRCVLFFILTSQLLISAQRVIAQDAPQPSTQSAKSIMIVSNITPVLGSTNLDASIEFYKRVFGFKLDWRGQVTASVSRDGKSVMFQKQEKLITGKIWIGGGAIYEIWNRVKNDPSIDIIQKPTNESYGLTMTIADPDGNQWWFATSELKQSEVPFGQELTEEQMEKASQRK